MEKIPNIALRTPCGREAVESRHGIIHRTAQITRAMILLAFSAAGAAGCSPSKDAENAILASSAEASVKASADAGDDPKKRPTHLRIIHLADFHGHVGKDKYLREGNRAARIATVIQELKDECERNDWACIVLDAGDDIVGTPYSTDYQGELEMLALNAFGVDASVLGNHDIDFGRDAFRRNVALAAHPVLAANYQTTQLGGSGWPILKSAVIIDKKGLKIGVIGLTHPQMESLVGKMRMQGFTVSKDAVADARALMSSLSAQSDVQIALTHEGMQADLALAGAIPELEAVIGGHDHLQWHCADVSGRPVCQTPAYGSAVGTVDFNISEDGSVKNTGESLVRVDSSVPPDSLVRDLLAPELAKTEKDLGVTIGSLAEKIPNKVDPINGQSLLGVFIAEAMKQSVEADFGLLNSGGIRIDALPKGLLTRGVIEEMLPFRNTVVVIEMTGKQLEDLIQESVAKGKFFQLAGGLKYFEKSQLDPNRKYTVAVSDYFVSGGGGYKVSFRVVNDTGKTITEAVLTSIRSLVSK